ncbi:MAG: chemotaxis-specific protein-glutamate methyltransferase CheB [Anaerolineae bacterium]|nr:chemotaxis-specific protein-glutamate methyltransferase CheB [Anaerolineae bacterium]
MPVEIGVLVVDDSPTFRQLLCRVIEADPQLHVVGEAANGQQAVQLTHDLRPDVILMDVVMPGMDGLAATREIMNQTPTPIVIVSASIDLEAEIAFQAVRAGALVVLKKPSGPGHAEHHEETRQLLGTLRTMAGVRVIHHWKRHMPPAPAAAAGPAPVQFARELPAEQPAPEIVAIVSSTGGPAALSEIVSKLPADFALPVVIAQHIAPDFVPALAEWLTRQSPLRVQIAADGTRLQPGCITLAPAAAHLRLVHGRRIALDRRRELSPYIPSGDVLLKSVATVYGARALGVVLTGMGADGAAGLRTLYEAGAWTIAQDEATSVVFGMPREAIARGAARQILALPEIGVVIANLPSPHRKH